MGKTLKELPYYKRPDLTPYLIHLTKARSDRSALDNLKLILEEGKINGTTSYVQGQTEATCFMDIPFAALKYVCSTENAERYEPYGIVVAKRDAYRQGSRPVLYLTQEDQREFKIPASLLWRVVKLEYDEEEDTWIDWQHEREWRRVGSYNLTNNRVVALVRTVQDSQLLQKFISTNKRVKCNPLSIIPLSVICQGLDG